MWLRDAQVGASNELPESEELDALYDRFLFRKQVEQVSAGGLASLLTETMGADALPHGHGEHLDASALQPSEIRGVKGAAVKAVRVPAEVVELLTDLRAYLQDKCEPPVYVSDRRLVKSIGMLKVAAYTSGRNVVSQYDCLLLQHVLWSRPEDKEKIYDWLLSQLAVDDGIKQVQYLLAGMFGRACRVGAGAGGEEGAELRQEVGSLRELLTAKLSHVADTVAGSFPAVRHHLWLGEEDAQAAASALSPKLSKNKKAVTRVLREVVTLEVALEKGLQPHVLAELMPEHWADFIRNGPIEDVKPLGLAAP